MTVQEQMTASPMAKSSQSEVDVVVVGAGLAGVYMLYKLKEIGLKARVFEAAPDVGGVWYWNCYPGARCDIQSIEYCYSFSPELAKEWRWRQRYASQPEILQYIQHVTDRFELRPQITFKTRVTSAVYNDAKNNWLVATDTGESVTARFFITAAGCLSEPTLPKIPGAEQFAGAVYHTGRWPHDEPVDFSGQKVGIIGTGSSGCQLIPLLADQADELYVFQRTPNHCTPANNYPLSESYSQRVRQRYEVLWKKWLSSPSGTSYTSPSSSALDVTDEEREEVYRHKWNNGGFDILVSFDDLLIDQAANDTAAEFLRGKVREIVKDPKLAEQLVPAEHPLASKRLCIVDGYYETFNRPNVHLVSARSGEPIETIEKNGVRTSKALYELETLIYATGFDAITGALLAIDIRGRGGKSLRDEWAKGASAYLGLAMAGYPNLFVITGPGSPSALSNVARSIEQHVEWITACLTNMLKKKIAVIEAAEPAQTAWMGLVDMIVQSTLLTKCKSWYTGDNIEGKPHQFLAFVAGFTVYQGQLDAVVEKDYEGFILSPEPPST